jgi:ribonuclease PH
MTGTTRADGRAPDALRPIKLIADPLKFPISSTRIEWGDTHVLCTVSWEEEQPRWMRETPQRGWVTAEYDMLPGSTPGGRKSRGRGTPDGRAQEIQRLIGRSLRAVVDLDKLGPRTL